MIEAGSSGGVADSGRLETATLGGGCFWCTEAVFSELRGVRGVVPGYAGGSVPSPSYEEVCTGTTGHAEVAQVTFSPREISYRDLLIVFFSTHDPTTRNRQGADVGSQYRSVVFFHSAEQRETAARVIRDLEAEKLWDRPFVTELVAFSVFYPAEEYHRDYYRRHPEAGYCQLVIAPKVAKFRKQFLGLLRAEPPLASR
jgi:peptide-methionine (S)-S-oxide reductase